MQIVKYHSHLNGYEWLLVHHPRVWKEIKKVIRSIDAEKCKTKVSKEKTMVGKVTLFARGISMRASQRASINSTGKRAGRVIGSRTTTNLSARRLHMAPKEQKAEIEAAGKRAIFSYNQTDFVRDRVAIEVQLGKYSFISYDLFVKHLAFYVGDQIDLGIEVLAMKSLQAQMSSGPGLLRGRTI